MYIEITAIMPTILVNMIKGAAVGAIVYLLLVGLVNLSSTKR